MRYRIKISGQDFERISNYFQASYPDEAAVFLLAGGSRHGDWEDVLVRRVIEVNPQDFDIQQEYQLRISPRAINGFMALCEVNNLGAGFAHSHPGEIPYSLADTHGEERLAATARSFSPIGTPFVSMLFSPRGLIAARVWTENEEMPLPVAEVVVIGNTVKKIGLDAPQAEIPSDKEVYSRQILALGSEGQAKIERAKIAIIGVGATGSACAEQLARLGAADILLVDHDRIDKSNVSRVYGSTQDDEGRPKVEVMRDYMLRIRKGIGVNIIFGRIQDGDNALALRDRDVIMLCTDDHWGRAIVNEICHRYLIPTINMGVRIDATESGGITGGVVTVDVLRPDKPCLWCKRSLDSSRIAAEAMSEKERAARQREGYIQGLDVPTPMVIPFTSLAASLATSNFMHLMTGFLGDGEGIERLNYSIVDMELSPGVTDLATNCICKKSRARGDIGDDARTIKSISWGQKSFSPENEIVELQPDKGRG